ncbi:MAG: uL15 family ribosomal protein [Candidatus Parcubacteria bacterium]|nr:uL15 family ribosomal protein [Candidatus Parcubacteria bacterium]
MQIHQLKPIHKLKPRKRVGRGGKHGSFSGRGTKGQLARSGRRLEPIIRGIIKRYPKLRGYRFNTFDTKPQLVDLSLLDKKFKEGDKVNPEILLKSKLVRRIKGRIPKVKIMNNGEINKALIIEKCLISKAAKEKIEKAGGTIK